MRSPERTLAGTLFLLSGCALSSNMTADLQGRDCPAYGVERGEEFWAVPSGVGDRRELDAWCRAVGPSVFRPDATILGPRLEDHDSIAVVVWNVSVGGGDILGLLQNEVGVECGPQPTAETHVVLLLQEALRRDASVPEVLDGTERQPTTRERESDRERIDMVSVAEQCGLSLLYVASSRNGEKEYPDGREDIGNAVLSTLPLDSPFAIELPHEASRRVAAGATVRLPTGRSVRVASLHFNTFPAPWKLLRTGNSSRVRQALALENGLNIVESGPAAEVLPLLAGGDLNTWSFSEGALRQLFRIFPDSPAWHGVPTRGSYPTDHLFFRNSSTQTALPQPSSYGPMLYDYNSDHYPVIAWLVLRSP